MKLTSILAEIENLKKEIHLSQSEVFSLTKQVKTLDTYQKLAIEALERSNKENVTLKQREEELNSRVPGLVE